MTHALSMLDTPKVATSITSTHNSDYRTNLLSKVFYANDYSVMTKKECAIKVVKEMGKGALDLSVKIMLTSQFFDDADGTMSWSNMDLEIDRVIKERLTNEAYAKGKASASMDVSM